MSDIDIRTEHGDRVNLSASELVDVFTLGIAELRAQARRAYDQKNAAYAERNRALVAFAAAVSLVPGWRVGRAEHPAYEAWEPDWRAILVIESPMGQMTWHFHDDERVLLEPFSYIEDYVWDGHTSLEKYTRLEHGAKLLRSLLVPPPGEEEPAEEDPGS